MIQLALIVVGALGALVVLGFVNRLRDQPRRAELRRPSRAARIDDDVQFTVARPENVQAGNWYTLLFSAHKSLPFTDEAGRTVDPIAEVTEQIEQRLGTTAPPYQLVRAESTVAIPRGDQLTIHVEAEEVTFNPPTRSFEWTESIHHEEFRFQVLQSAHAGATRRGRLSVYLGALLVADVPLTFHIGAGPAGPIRETVSPYRNIFPSYSRDDRQIVDHVIAITEGTGDKYLRDVTVNRAGEVFEDRLYELIEEADAFQLFWSWNSMDSDWVRKEWSHALSLGRKNFVRPVYWEDPMPERDGQPPPPLAKLHFHEMPFAEVSGSVPRPQSQLDQSPAGQKPRSWSIALTSASWVLVVAVVAVAGVALFGGRTSDPNNVDQVPTRFEVAYNSDNPQALLDLLDERVVAQLESPESFERLDFGQVAIRREWSIALNEQLRLTDCEIVDTSTVVCLAERFDDLVRAARTGSWQSEVMLRFENSKIVEWNEIQFGLPDYQVALARFERWLFENQPEPPPLLGSPTWRFEEDSETAARLINEFAQFEGVLLGG